MPFWSCCTASLANLIASCSRAVQSMIDIQSLTEFSLTGICLVHFSCRAHSPRVIFSYSNYVNLSTSISEIKRDKPEMYRWQETPKLSYLGEATALQLDVLVTSKQPRCTSGSGGRVVLSSTRRHSARSDAVVEPNAALRWENPRRNDWRRSQNSDKNFPMSVNCIKACVKRKLWHRCGKMWHPHTAIITIGRFRLELVGLVVVVSKCPNVHLYSEYTKMLFFILIMPLK